MGSSPITFSNVQPLAASAPITFSNIQPLDKPATPQPGALSRFASSAVATMPGAGAQPADLVKGPAQALEHPLDSAKLVWDALNSSQAATQQRALEQLKQPGVWNKAEGAIRGLYGMIPVIGPMLEKAGDQFKSGDVAGGLGTTAGLGTQMVVGSPEGRANVASMVPKRPEFAEIETNPNVLYHKYLDPIKNQPLDLPPMPPRVANALTKKVEINNPDIAARIEAGKTTVGDVDTIRQVAWTAGKSAVTAIGRPTEMSLGFMRAHDALAQTLYPAIEQYHGLPAGSMGELKLSLGRLQNLAPIFGKQASVPGMDIGVPEAIGRGMVGRVLNPVSAMPTLGRAVTKGLRTGTEAVRTAIKSATLPEPQP